MSARKEVEEEEKNKNKKKTTTTTTTTSRCEEKTTFGRKSVQKSFLLKKKATTKSDDGRRDDDEKAPGEEVKNDRSGEIQHSKIHGDEKGEGTHATCEHGFIHAVVRRRAETRARVKTTRRGASGDAVGFFLPNES